MNKMAFAEKYLGMGLGLIPLVPTVVEEKNSGKIPARKGFFGKSDKNRRDG